MALNPKQQRFVDEYLVDLNATQAAIRSGYSKKTAYSIGDELLKKPEVAARVQAAMDKRAERTEITADYVLTTIRETIERCQGVGLSYQPNAVLKGAELLGKHLKMFTDKVELAGPVKLILSREDEDL
jgi:phage terminase small subunit